MPLYPFYNIRGEENENYFLYFIDFNAIVVFLVSSGTDKLDGYIARKYNQITNLGKLVDPLADKLLISVALIMMVQLNIIPVPIQIAN